MAIKYISQRHSPKYLAVEGAPLDKAKSVFEHHLHTLPLNQSENGQTDFYGDVWFHATREDDRLEGIRKTVVVRCWYVVTTPVFEDRSHRPDVVFEIQGFDIEGTETKGPMMWRLWVNKETLPQHTKLNSAVVGARMKS